MGHALKITNVDFSSVALSHVTYIESVPCTSISLAPSSISFDTVEEKKQLTASITPANTTDILLWSSTNDNVASVDNTGMVTIHGVGTATIKATCGSQTASVTIIQSSIKAQYPLKSVADKYLAQLPPNDTSQVLALQASTGQYAIGQLYHTDNDHLKVYNGPKYEFELIPVPYGATIVKMATTNGQAVQINYIDVADTNSFVTFNSNDYPKFLREKSFFSTETGYAVEYGEAIGFRMAGSIDTLDYVYFE